METGERRCSRRRCQGKLRSSALSRVYAAVSAAAVTRYAWTCRKQSGLPVSWAWLWRPSGTGMRIAGGRARRASSFARRMVVALSCDRSGESGDELCAIHPFKPSSCREWTPGLDRPECQAGLARRWGITVDSSGELKGPDERMRDLRLFIDSLASDRRT